MLLLLLLLIMLMLMVTVMMMMLVHYVTSHFTQGPQRTRLNINGIYENQYLHYYTLG